MRGRGAYPNRERWFFNRSGVDKAVQVVLFDDLVREKIQGQCHVLVPGHGGAVVEVLNVERHKPGVGGRYGSVEQTLRGGEAGAVGGGVGGSRVVEYVTADSDTDTVDLSLVQADGGNHVGICDLAVGGYAGFGNVEDSVGSARHASSDALGEAAKIVGQAGAPGRLVGAL